MRLPQNLAVLGLLVVKSFASASSFNDIRGIVDAPCQQSSGEIAVPSCENDSGTASRRVAYYESWNFRRRACDKAPPNRINTDGFTHIIWAFLTIDPTTFVVGPMHPDDVKTYQQFLSPPNGLLKWISVGGWDFTESSVTRLTWSQMTSKEQNRKAFIDSLKQFLAEWTFTGVDISWEWPGIASRGGTPDDRLNYVRLVTELRQALGPQIGLSVVLPAQYEYLKGFDLKGLESQVDFFNFLTYDLHGTWDADTPELGPFIRPHTDLQDIDAALKLLWSAEIKSSKINLGIANYARGFTVADKSCMKVGCQFKGPSSAGSCTNLDGVLSSCEVNRIVAAKGLSPQMVSNSSGVKEIHWDDQWVGYDDKETLVLKLELANKRCLGGTALWAIDYDTCDGSSTPLVSSFISVVSTAEPFVISNTVSTLPSVSLSLPQNPSLSASDVFLTPTFSTSVSARVPPLDVSSSAVETFSANPTNSLLNWIGSGTDTLLSILSSRSTPVTVVSSSEQINSAKQSVVTSEIEISPTVQISQTQTKLLSSNPLISTPGVTTSLISLVPDSGFISVSQPATVNIGSTGNPSSVFQTTAESSVFSSDSNALQLQTISVNGSENSIPLCTNFPCVVAIPERSLTTPQTVAFPPFTESLVVVSGGSTGTTTGEVETMTSGSVTKVLITFLTVKGCSTSNFVSTIFPSNVTISQLPSCAVLVQSASATLPQHPCVYPTETTITVALNTYPVPWYSSTNSAIISGPNTFDSCVFESRTQIGIVPVGGSRQRCPQECLLYEWCKQYCDVDLLPAEMPSQCRTFKWCLLFWGQHNSQTSNPAPDDKDPACVPNDCVKDCFFWRVATWTIFKRPVCPCIPVNCDKPTSDKKCKLFGCGCGWMGLDFGPGCEKEGYLFELPGLGFPCGLFGCNPCGFFGCPPNGANNENGILGFRGYCLVEGGCEPCPPEICSGPACTVEGGCGPKPGPPPTTPADRPQTCEDEQKTRVTERFVWCTEGFAVSELPSSIGGTSTSLISTLCVPLVEATMKVCPGAMVGYTTTTTKSATTTLSSEALACSRAPLALDDDEGSNIVDAGGLSSTRFAGNTTKASVPLLGRPSELSRTMMSSSQPSSSSSSTEFSTSSLTPSLITSSIESSSESSASLLVSSSIQSRIESSTEWPSISATSSSPQPTLGSMDRFGSWSLHMELWMVQKSSGENWTLYDPNGYQAGQGYSQGINLDTINDYVESMNRPEQQSMPYGVKVMVHDPTNVDKTRAEFVVDKNVPQCPFVQCRPGMITEDKTEDNMFEVRSCEDQCEGTTLHDADFWCDDLNDALWLPSNGGWKRKFRCGFKGF